MNPSLVQIWTAQAAVGSWIPVFCPLPGSMLKCWVNFDNDLLVCSDPNSPVTQTTLKVANGNQFEVPYSGPVTMNAQRPIFYVQGASQTVNVTLFTIMQ